MGSKDILIISQTFYPENSPRSFRTTELAKELARQGHYVTVLLPFGMNIPAIHEWAEEHGVQFQFYGPLTWKYFGKTRLFGDWSRKFGRLLFLLFEYPNIEIYFKLPKYLRKIEKTYDLLISIAVPHENHWSVARVHSKRKLARTWVADCGDPFAGNKMERISPPFYLRIIEYFFLKEVDFVTVPAIGHISAYCKRYENKFRVIPQGFDFSIINLSEYFKKSPKVVFAYAGGITRKGGIRSPHKLIEYLNSLHNLDYEFHIYSSQIAEIVEFEKDNVSKVKLHKGIHREKLLNKLSEMDFLVNFDYGSNAMIPSKLIDYALTKRPILNINANEPDTQLIDAFLSGDYSGQYVVEDVDQYNIKNVSAKFLALDE